MTPRGQVVAARDLRVGDVVLLRIVGPRRIVRVDHDTTVGMTGRPCVRVVYATSGGGGSYENRSTEHGPSRFPQKEAGMKPLDPDETVLLERRETP